MARREIPEGTTFTIRAEGFHDERDPTNLLTPGAPTVFLDAATIKTADLTDVSDPNSPVAIGTQQTLVGDGSGGGYGVDIPHDFATSAITKGKRVSIVVVLEEGPVHWETPSADRVHIVV